MPHTIGDLLQQAGTILVDSDSATLDAQILLAHSWQKDRSFLHAWPHRTVPADIEREFLTLVERRRQHEPIAYIMGKKEFWSLSLQVNAHVLIPRPETELLVEHALAVLPAKRKLSVADIGTGSGAIALAIAHERPHCAITACDISAGALDTARANAKALHISDVRFVQSDLFTKLGDLAFDLIASNPPYVKQQDSHLAALRFEPGLALRAGADGLRVIEKLIAQAPAHLNKQGWMILEHGYDQKTDVCKLLEQGGFSRIESYRDLAGHWRGVIAQLP